MQDGGVHVGLGLLNSLAATPPQRDRGAVIDHFAGAVAERYDAVNADRFAPDLLGATTACLAELAGPGGRALELAIGTGRVAIPLHERGVEVHGIDLSPDMLARLHDRTTAIPTTVGDIATTRLAGPGFDLVYLVFNTIGNLTTQDQQVDCFANAAAHLRSGGRFVVEVGVPDLRRLPPGQDTRVFSSTADHLGVDEYDTANQRLISHHHLRDEHGGWHVTAMPFRYVWPSELDLMARLAGMHLEHRWADWHRTPFTAESRAHVSVWRLPG